MIEKTRGDCKNDYDHDDEEKKKVGKKWLSFWSEHVKMQPSL